MSKMPLTNGEFPPAEAWREFIKMRKAKRAPMTEYAQRLMLARLAKLVKDGQDAEEVLNQSIVHCWTDIYPLKVEQVQSAGAQALSKAGKATARNIEAWLVGKRNG